MKKLTARKLGEYARDSKSLLIQRVVADALECEGEETSYLTDVCNHGCVSGSCSGLIYYTDTHAFYNDYADEIDEMVSDLQDNLGDIGEIITKNGDIRNNLAWLAYEETARKILEDNGIEL